MWSENIEYPYLYSEVRLNLNPVKLKYIRIVNLLPNNNNKEKSILLHYLAEEKY